MGDNFLRETLPVLQAIKSQSIKNNSAQPFIYEYYNVIPLFGTANAATDSFLGKIFNQMVEELNNRVRLLKYIIICLDKDIIEYLKQNDFGIQCLMHDAITWLARNIEIYLDLRRADIKKKNPGALWSSSEPRIVWVKMVPQPMIKNKGHIYSHSKKFNDILEDLVFTFKHTHILPIQFPDNKELFNRDGTLSNTGKVIFWREVNVQMRAFDGEKIDLKPTQISQEGGDHKRRQGGDAQVREKPPQKSDRKSSSEERTSKSLIIPYNYNDYLPDRKKVYRSRSRSHSRGRG